MDRFQTAVLEAINHRETGSYKNWITIHNSYHTENDYTSDLIMHGFKVATVRYKHSVHDPNFNILGGKRGEPLNNDSKWEVEKITFFRKAMDRIRGTLPSRYRNFLGDHFVTETK